MRSPFSLLLLLVLIAACEKVVEIKEIVPREVVYCGIQNDVQGSWVSDSVHVVSVIDTVDSVVEDKAPTLTYFLDVQCASETAFRLSYVTFAGVETEDVRSTNFEEANGRFYVFNQLDSLQDTSLAPFKLDYRFEDENRITATMTQNPNAVQTTTYTLFLRRTL